ncbi:MAG: hypothetical protein H0V18_13450 [Pyrinomonadaceae bacterium]|nr:hypothetical protein [Pyrinomonadaceae bacterium]
MIFKFDISAGGFFELIRPAVLVLSALASIWVLASARRHRFLTYVAIGWALGTLFFPLITLPLYLIALFIRRRSEQTTNRGVEAGNTFSSSAAPSRPVVIPLAYAAVVLSLIGFYLYWDYQSVDGHLARAVQAKLSGKRGGTIDEYRAALKLEDNPHTRKLLALELADTGDWTGALFELRMAEQGGEVDDLMAFYIATLLDSLNLPNQATLEYQRFLESRVCTQPVPEERCSQARVRVQVTRAESRPR